MEQGAEVGAESKSCNGDSSSDYFAHESRIAPEVADGVAAAVEWRTLQDKLDAVSAELSCKTKRVEKSEAEIAELQRKRRQFCFKTYGEDPKVFCFYTGIHEDVNFFDEILILLGDSVQ